MSWSLLSGYYVCVTVSHIVEAWRLQQTEEQKKNKRTAGQREWTCLSQCFATWSPTSTINFPKFLKAGSKAEFQVSTEETVKAKNLEGLLWATDWEHRRKDTSWSTLCLPLEHRTARKSELDVRQTSAESENRTIERKRQKVFHWGRGGKEPEDCYSKNP